MQLLWNILVSGSIYALVTLGFALTYSTANFFNMAHGAAFLVGGYVGYIVFRIFGLGILLTLILAGVFAGLFGVGVQRIVFQRLIDRKASRLVLFIASLGILVMVEGLISAFFGNQTAVLQTGPSRAVALPGGSMTIVQGETLSVSLLIFGTLSLLLKVTDSGRNIRAVSDDRDLAITIGIPVRAVLTSVFFWGSAMAGLAGVLVGLDQSIRPGSGMVAILWAMVASIIGGVGSLIGAVLGAFLVATLENAAVSLFPTEWKTAIVFSALVIFLLLRPTGLLGGKQ